MNEGDFTDELDGMRGVIFNLDHPLVVQVFLDKKTVVNMSAVCTCAVTFEDMFGYTQQTTHKE